MWKINRAKILITIKFNFMNRKLFEDIDARLLYGVKCSESNQMQQNYFERLKIQTKSAFNNKRYV